MHRISASPKLGDGSQKGERWEILQVEVDITAGDPYAQKWNARSEHLALGRAARSDAKGVEDCPQAIHEWSMDCPSIILPLSIEQTILSVGVCSWSLYWVSGAGSASGKSY